MSFMVKITRGGNVGVVERIVRGLRPDAVANLVEDATLEVEPRMLSELREMQPPPPQYVDKGGGAVRRIPPMKWTSTKQRRAFFATRGFGRGIPTQRTGMTINSFDVTTERISDGECRVIFHTTSPTAPFIFGLPGFAGWQQGFHIDLGWPTITTMRGFITKYSEELFRSFVSKLEAALKR